MTANGFQELRQDVHEWCHIVNLRALRAFSHSIQELFERNISQGAEDVDRKVGIALKAFLGTLLEPGDLPPRHRPGGVKAISRSGMSFLLTLNLAVMLIKIFIADDT